MFLTTRCRPRSAPAPAAGWRRPSYSPPRNDPGSSPLRAAATIADLLDAGVRIFEYHGGLLHTKSLTLDGEMTLIGSANMDRRSFELNYENNILFYDPELTGDMRRRQESYIAESAPVTPDAVAGLGLATPTLEQRGGHARADSLIRSSTSARHA